MCVVKLLLCAFLLALSGKGDKVYADCSRHRACTIKPHTDENTISS